MEVLTGRRRPKERREEEDSELRAKPPLFARGRASASVGEEAAGGGEGSRETATMRGRQWTWSRARRRQDEEVPQHKRPLDAATAQSTCAVMLLTRSPRALACSGGDGLELIV